MRISVSKAVLFLHAFPLSSEMYFHQFRALEEKKIPYLAPDYPGFGNSPNLPGDITIERLTDHTVGKLTELGVKKVIAVGDSMGGYIIFDMFRRYRDLLAGMVFVSTRAEGETPEGKKARYNLIGRVKEEGKGFLINMMLENQTSPATKKDPHKMNHLRCIMEKATEEGIIKTLKALAERRDSTDLLASIDLPALVVAGKNDDRVTPPEVVKKIADGIKGSTYVELENSAHLPPFENPYEFNRVLLNFVEYCW